MADKKKAPAAKADKKKQQKTTLPKFVTKIEIKNLKLKLMIAGMVAVFALSTWLIVAGVQSYYKVKFEGPVITGLRALEQGKQQKGQAVLMRAATKGNKVAAMYMAWIEGRRGNFHRALDYIRQSSEDKEDNPGGFEILGDLALLGYGQATGAGPALYYFNEALNQVPYEERDEVMRRMLEHAIGLCMNLNDYLRLVDEATKLESPLARLLRGDVEFLGEEGGKLSPSSANRSWDGAEADGLTEAMVRKAGAFWHGYGVARNYEQAINLYKSAAKQGDPGAIYSEGLITMRIKQAGAFDQGMSLFRKSAELGYAPAMTAVAILSLVRNRQDPEVIAEALNLFKTAHEKGDYTASLYYSLMLYNGVGTEVDINRALSILFDLKDHDIKAVDGYMDFLTYVTTESLLPVLDQLLELNYLQFLGELHFIAGAPEASMYEGPDSDPSFFKPPFEDSSISDKLKEKLGNNYISKLLDPNEVEINGEPLIVPEFAYALSQSEPSTQAKRFVPPLVTRIEADLPPLPPDFADYGLDMETISKAFDDDFVPNVSQEAKEAEENVPASEQEPVREQSRSQSRKQSAETVEEPAAEIEESAPAKEQRKEPPAAKSRPQPAETIEGFESDDSFEEEPEEEEFEDLEGEADQLGDDFEEFESMGDL